MLEVGSHRRRYEFIESLAKPLFEMALCLGSDGFDLQAAAALSIRPADGSLARNLDPAFGEAEFNEHRWVSGNRRLGLNRKSTLTQINDLHLLRRQLGKRESSGQ